jgi:hypothetical protein
MAHSTPPARTEVTTQLLRKRFLLTEIRRQQKQWSYYHAKRRKEQTGVNLKAGK